MGSIGIVILAVAFVCLIVIAVYLRTSGSRGKKSREELLDSDIEEAFPGESGNKEEGPGKKASGSALLFIPSEMLDDKRNEDIRHQVEETVREFSWGTDGGKSALIYSCKQDNTGWKCPYCEGENSVDAPLCMICGRNSRLPYAGL